MNLPSLKSAFFQNRINQLATKFRNIEYQVPIKKIGILIDEKHVDSLYVLNNLKSEFDISEANFSVLLFKATNQEFSDFNGVLCGKKDLSFNGKLKNLELVKFVDEPKDILITFAEENNVYVNLLTSKCNAGIKIGRHAKSKILDLVLETGEDAQLFVSEVKKIVNKLK